jgi:DNA-binding IclR family transcriptional regulator
VVIVTPRKDAKKLIVKALSKHPEGLMLTEIAEITGMNRFTVTKYIHELIGNGSVFQKEAAAARICYLKEDLVRRMKNREIIESLRKKVDINV